VSPAPEELRTSYAEPDPTGIERRLWLGVLLGPLGWIAALMIGYPIAARVCGSRGILLSAALTAATALAATVGIMLARRNSRWLGGASSHDDVRAGRRRLMAKGGVVVGALMLAIIAGHGIALLFLRPC
jgi:hypothetical protein